VRRSPGQVLADARRLFASQARWENIGTPDTVFDSLARSTGVDMKRWRQCVTSGAMRPLIEADRDRASRAGASATPSFMIGDKLLTGAQPLDALQQAIDSASVKNRSSEFAAASSLRLRGLVTEALVRVVPAGDTKFRRGLSARRDVVNRFADWAAKNRNSARPLVWFHAPSVGEGCRRCP